jgi:cytochrome P450
MTASPLDWPAPGYRGVLGHVPRWGSDSLALLEEGARLGPVFSMRLWRKALVGYRPDWNRLVLGDLDGFRSRGSLSQLSPYLSGGVVALDAPAHRSRRAELNPAFHRRVVTGRFADRLDALAVHHLPVGEFDAVGWASALIRRMIAATFLGPEFPDAVLASFLAPLDRGLPGPLLPRPLRIRRMERALAGSFVEPDEGTMAPLFASLADGVQEARVAIAAAYDTTAHTLAFALWELAAHPEFNAPEVTDVVVQETLRLYPAGWIGSRVSLRDNEFDGRVIPAGRLVLYSPYLTHRDPELWHKPLDFTPERFAGPLPAWGYLPFSAGERTCLGASLATLMLRAAVRAFAGADLTRVTEQARPRGVVTLSPSGPMVLHRRLPRSVPRPPVPSLSGRREDGCSS